MALKLIGLFLKPIFTNHYVKTNDFVVAVRDFNEVENRSVGLVRRVNGDIDVYFVGIEKTINTTPDNVKTLDVTKTGKPRKGPLYPTKICNICHKLKNHFTEFERNQNDSQGRPTMRPSCRECRIPITGKTLSKTERLRMDVFKPKKHAVYVCPICEKHMIVGVTAEIRADHSSRSGRGRAWLCDSCNTGLGRFKDDIVFFEKIVAYLKQHG